LDGIKKKENSLAKHNHDDDRELAKARDCLIEDQVMERPHDMDWRKNGLGTLGPLGCLPVDKIADKLEVSIQVVGAKGFDKSKNTYTVTHEGKTSLGHKKIRIYTEKGPHGFAWKGTTSPPNNTTINKDLLGLSKNIQSFAWCYPLDGFDAAAVDSILEQFKIEEIEVNSWDYFLLFGGYIYWFEKIPFRTPSTIISAPVHALGIFNDGDFFMFTAPRKLPDIDEWCNEKYFGCITISEFPANYFRWLTPAECQRLLALDVHDDEKPSVTHLYEFKSDATKNVHILGGFAYLYPDARMNNYFLLLEPPPREAKR
jgi:hypothetical protein